MQIRPQLARPHLLNVELSSQFLVIPLRALELTAICIGNAIRGAHLPLLLKVAGTKTGLGVAQPNGSQSKDEQSQQIQRLHFHLR